MLINGREVSFEHVVLEYYDMIQRFTFMLLLGSNDVDDVCQEVFLCLFRHTEDFNSYEHLKAWLMKVARNRCRKIWSSSWFRRIVFLENLDFFEYYVQYPSEIDYAVEELPLFYRSLVQLYYYEELSIREISALINKKESTIASALDRIRKKLRKILREDYDMHFL